MVFYGTVVGDFIGCFLDYLWWENWMGEEDHLLMFKTKCFWF